MKKLLLIVALLLVATFALAEFKLYTFKVDNVSPGTTAVTDYKVITGVPRRFSYSADTNMIVTLATVAAYGGSPGSAQTLYSIATTNMTDGTNIASTIYLMQDRVILSAHTSSDTNGAADCTGRLLVEE